VAGLQFLGMRWSQLQWMVAALTVGLGFGLQEIFANFVSGLILLFERPFRVGDVISVGDLTGRVTRIHTRATTILDFDNREIVVPNKNFITGQLLNWTLSDTMTRIIIKVGVAYGTDPDQVHRLLLQAAAGNPLVQREPEPLSWFIAFGASSLDFELRVFVGTLADRLRVQSELLREIARIFGEHGIEIAFPQMDLHVRDLPEDHQPSREGDAGQEQGATNTTPSIR
jgi:potassium efflux system protein